MVRREDHRMAGRQNSWMAGWLAEWLDGWQDDRVAR
jgi:hypothetical protein